MSTSLEFVCVHICKCMRVHSHDVIIAKTYPILYYKLRSERFPHGMFLALIAHWLDKGHDW